MNILKSKAIKGSIYFAILNIFSKIIKVISSIFLARVLTPDDYGIIAIAMVIITGMNRLNQFGINVALIRRKKLTNIVKSNGNSLKFITSLIIVALIFIISPYWASFYNNNAVENILKVMSLVFLIDAFVFIDKVVLTRDMNFKILSLSDAIGIFFGSILSLFLAYNDYGYWSIIYGMLLSAIIRVFIIKSNSKERLKFEFDIKIARHLLSFGGWVFLGGFLFWGYTTIDNVVIGKLLGVATLGYYAVAYGWGTFAAENIQNIITKTLFPAYSVMAADPARIKNVFLKVAKVNSLIVIPVTFGLMSIADYFIMFVLGEKWWPAYEILLVLSIFGLLRALDSGSVSIFYAMNKPKYYVLLSAITFVLILLTIYPAINSFGVIGAGVSITFSIFVSFVIQQFLLSHLLGLSISDIVAIWLLPFFSSMLMVLVISLIKSLLLPGLTSLVYLIAIGILTYFTALIIFTKGEIFSLYLELKKS